MGTICSSCLEECEEVTIKDGFYYDYGDICGAWHDESYEGSSCCGERVLEGHVFLDSTTRHIARKDHEGGKICKGDLYIATIRKGYYIDDDEVHHAIFDYHKRVIMTKDELENGNWEYNKFAVCKWKCKECSKTYARKPNSCKECERIEREAMSLIGEVEV